MFFLIRPVGLRCQLRCGYCYYKDGHDDLRQLSRQRMSLEVVRKLLSGLALLPSGDHTFCLHGGEPLLMGKRWFENFVGLVDAYNHQHRGRSNVSIAIQTNAVLVDQDWVKLFLRGKIGVSVSLDGPAAVHDSGRRTPGSHGTHSAVVDAIQLMADAGIRLGGLAVITAESVALGPKTFYEYFQSIPLRNGLDVMPYIETGMSAGELAARATFEAPARHLSQFFRDLFDLWLLDNDERARVDIRMFEQLIGSALGFFPSLCNLTQGASCGRTPSVLPNGDVYACDLDVATVNFRMGSVLTDSIANICSTDRLQDVHARVLIALRSQGCADCQLLPFCGLTCPRHVFSRRDHSEYCELMRDLADHTRTTLTRIATEAFADSIEFEAGVHPLLKSEASHALIAAETGH